MNAFVDIRHLMKWGGWEGACPCGDPQSVSLDLSYHKEHQYIWFRDGDLNSS